jgi:anti-anti-sigma factor
MSVQQVDTSSERRDQARAPAVAGAGGDRGGSCWCSWTSPPSPTGEVIVLGVAGEVDLCSLPVLRAALAEVIGRRSDHVIVDLAEVRFCSVRGLTVLAEAGATAAGAGTEYAIGGASRLVNRVWALGWPDAELPIRFPTAGAAVLAALAHLAGRRDQVGNPARRAPKHLPRAAAPVVNPTMNAAGAQTATRPGGDARVVAPVGLGG